MNIETFRAYCLSKPHVTEHFPFDEDTLVFKIAASKMFAAISLSDAQRANLKCDPEKAVTLRTSYTAVIPGYHMNKKHWNTVYFNGDIEPSMIKSLIDHSYELVYHGLTRKQKTAFPI